MSENIELKLLKLYFAPINLYGNFVYRHLLSDSDFVFSEMIDIDKIELEQERQKLNFFDSDLSKTIFQVILKKNSDVKQDLDLFFEKLQANNVKELNLNACCPQAGMLLAGYCGGLVNDLISFEMLTKNFSKYCSMKNIISSVKIRLGDRENIKLASYLDVLGKSHVNKVYVHFRGLYHPYFKKAIYTKKIFDVIYEYKKKYDFEIIIGGDIANYYDLILKVTLAYCELKEFKSVDEFVRNFNLFKSEIIGFLNLIDGVMLGRGALFNPCVFYEFKEQNKKFNEFEKIQDYDIFDYLLKHDFLDNVMFGKKINYEFFKSFIENYLISAKKNSLRIDSVKASLKYVFKGFDNSNKVIKKINLSKNYFDLENIKLF